VGGEVVRSLWTLQHLNIVEKWQPTQALPSHSSESNRQTLKQGLSAGKTKSKISRRLPHVNLLEGLTSKLKYNEKRAKRNTETKGDVECDLSNKESDDENKEEDVLPPVDDKPAVCQSTRPHKRRRIAGI